MFRDAAVEISRRATHQRRVSGFFGAGDPIAPGPVDPAGDVPFCPGTLSGPAPGAGSSDRPTASATVVETSSLKEEEEEL
jgi:hypothetical protein